MKKKKPKSLDPTAQVQESKLLDELCTKYGYMFQDAPKGQRISMTMTKDPKGGRRIDASYRIFLIVPSTSALGMQFAERYNQLSKPKAKR